MSARKTTTRTKTPAKASEPAYEPYEPPECRHPSTETVRTLAGTVIGTYCSECGEELR